MGVFAEILDWDLSEVAFASDALGKRATGAEEYSQEVRSASGLKAGNWDGASATNARALAAAHADHTDRIAAQARTLIGPFSDYLAGGQTIKAAAQNLVAEAHGHGLSIGPDGSVAASQKGLYAQTIAKQLADKVADILYQDGQLHQNLAQAIHGVLGPDQVRSALTASAAVAPDPGIPQRAFDTLQKIDAGTWPGSAAPGTHGGTTWTNREGTLPATDDQGNPVSYQEWDVNDHIPHHNRDAERIVTGSDGSAWYTGDHYATFQRMR